METPVLTLLTKSSDVNSHVSPVVYVAVRSANERFFNKRVFAERKAT